MRWVHIHIEGLVQGVGFRPFVFKLASWLGLKGTVCNGVDGVHIKAGGDAQQIEMLLYLLKDDAPKESVITSFTCKDIVPLKAEDFQIVESKTKGTPNLLITPDLGLCDNCRTDITAIKNKRYNYPFTTCTHCGPRYSIMKSLPYDRHTTSMESFEMCAVCETEYHDPYNRRHFSQTNSCPDCTIHMKLVDRNGNILATQWQEVLPVLINHLHEGNIAAVKGIGGYLLMTDATNKEAVRKLRTRKHRPAKPFALMYLNTQMLQGDAEISDEEIKAFESIQSPIVLVKTKEFPASGICADEIAPGLKHIGAMRPYTAMFELLMREWKKPIIATSGNVSGSPIVYEDDEALKSLNDIADVFLMHDRAIQISEDDSVMRFANKHQLMIRRSRGYAPTYFNTSFTPDNSCVLALGADMKSAFALQANGRIYVSQYLGDLETYESQQFFKHTLEHMLSLLRVQPQQILTDAHPDYYATQLGHALATLWSVPVEKVHHHQAHAWSVLAENKLLQKDEPVLCVVWDGTGYGQDKQIWGGEFFIHHHNTMKRSGHLSYTPVWNGDAMAREPRLSALYMCKDLPEVELLKGKFTDTEWNYYSKLIQSKETLHTSSMGRLFDAMSSILNLCNHNTFEGEAAMLLEAAAREGVCEERYEVSWNYHTLEIAPLLNQVWNDMKANVPAKQIAYKFHAFLAEAIYYFASHHHTKDVALSGGVFQNALLVEMIEQRLHGHYHLHLHKELSPNDENISVGQLAYYHIKHQHRLTDRELSDLLDLTPHQYVPRDTR
jgi:hydrogenase maturation protein HypF